MAMEFERRQDENGVTLTYRPWAGGEPVELRYERPLPERMQTELAECFSQAQTGKKKPRRKKRRVIIVSSIFVLLVCLGIGIWYLEFFRGDPVADYWEGTFPPYEDDYYWDRGDTSTAESTIARYPTGGEVRLVLNEEHGEEPLTAGEIYEKVNPSVVTVLGEQNTSYSVGTGVIFSEDGYIITNYHVISGCSACAVWVTDSYGVDTEYPARLVGYDEDNDLAVLKIDAVDLPVAEFGVSDDLKVGDRVYAIGNPLGLELRNTLTDGLVSAIDRDVDVEGITMTLIQTNAALNSGNSGGPLINQYGQVVGINTIKMMSGEDTIEGLGFAIPTSLAVRWVNEMIQYGEIQPQPVLGLSISLIPETLPDGEQGLEIVEVTPGLSGDKAGILVGDYIVSFAGQEVKSTAEILAIRRELQVGDLVPVRIWRNGEYLDLTMEMMAQED